LPVQQNYCQFIYFFANSIPFWGVLQFFANSFKIFASLIPRQEKAAISKKTNEIFID